MKIENDHWYNFFDKKLFWSILEIRQILIKGILMKDLLGALAIHIAIAVLLGWFLIEVIS